MGQDGLAIFVYCDEEVALGVECKPGDIPSVGEGESVRFVVDEVEDGDAIAHG